MAAYLGGDDDKGVQRRWGQGLYFSEVKRRKSYPLFMLVTQTKHTNSTVTPFAFLTQTKLYTFVSGSVLAAAMSVMSASTPCALTSFLA